MRVCVCVCVCLVFGVWCWEGMKSIFYLAENFKRNLVHRQFHEVEA